VGGWVSVCVCVHSIGCLVYFIGYLVHFVGYHTLVRVCVGVCECEIERVCVHSIGYLAHCI